MILALCYYYLRILMDILIMKGVKDFLLSERKIKFYHGQDGEDQ